MTAIQNQFGQAVIDMVTNFGRSEIKTRQEFESDEFLHVNDPSLRTALAGTLYGARWMYKIGLGLLVDGDERNAHIRAQIIDYASICEALLSDLIRHCITRNLMTGTAYLTENCKTNGRQIQWQPGSVAEKMLKRSFWWLITVAADERILSTPDQIKLMQLKNLRNTVHLTLIAANNHTYYIGLASRSYSSLYDVIRITKQYRNSHP